MVEQLEEWHSKTSDELVEMRKRRVEFLKQNFALAQELKQAKKKIESLEKALVAADALSDWPEERCNEP